MNKCNWCYASKELELYHDNEWGKPVYDEREIFELLSLELMQAGLSWQTVLRKRDAFRIAFYDFKIEKIASFDEKKIEELVHNSGIIRNRQKIEAIINNARILNQKDISLKKLLWKYVDETPILNQWESIEQVPAQTKLSRQMARDFKKLGFKFVGPTIMYSFMQATGLVNDHIIGCPCK
ncbi:DNA-3-methyladenine glycosylase I [Ligilactobacillus sp. WILCCON 0076]|uniref:DNA-3-methyladenine glycosylase I n=1 Tax=Ligilactobacillus ubinensis TaxID=2876789 RepID=A0A9X2JM60_9LACO|nr:DNA-3-methyladenine glycosylase I [Ligilactobacillus ubinensis]MCP0887668.1 DNA-3-methyladenine glycosylase I [Ligilactobacillus ubinensis]